MTSTDDGKAIDLKPLRQNALCSSLDNFESAGNITEARNGHDRKQFSQMTSTDAGIEIDVSGHPKNASLSIRDSLDGISKVTNATEFHLAKHPSQIDSIVDPIVIASRGLKDRIRNRPKISVRISSFIQKLVGNDENVIDSFSRPRNAKPERKETPYGTSMWRRLA
jgi:hypothetical protein